MNPSVRGEIPKPKENDVCKTQGKRCRHNGVVIANHCAIVSVLRVVNLLRRSIFSTAGSFGNYFAF